MFFWNSVAFSMIQRMFAICSLVLLPFSLAASPVSALSPCSCFSLPSFHLVPPARSRPCWQRTDSLLTEWLNGRWIDPWEPLWWFPPTFPSFLTVPSPFLCSCRGLSLPTALIFPVCRLRVSRVHNNVTCGLSELYRCQERSNPLHTSIFRGCNSSVEWN